AGGTDLDELGFQLGAGSDRVEKTLHLLRVGVDVVGGDRASGGNQRQREVEVFFVVGFPGVDENEIEGALEGGDDLESVAQARFDDVFHAGGFEVFQRQRAAALVDIQGEQL